MLTLDKYISKKACTFSIQMRGEGGEGEGDNSKTINNGKYITSNVLIYYKLPEKPSQWSRLLLLHIGK